MNELTETQTEAARVKRILGLNTCPVGVKFNLGAEAPSVNARKLNGYRYCQALMAARNGKHVILEAEGIACPAAAAAFGFKPLPDGLRTGKALRGFGIIADAQTGRRMFEGMATLEPDTLKSPYLSPLEQAIETPDVIVVEDEVEKLMWFALAQLNMQCREHIESSMTILQATYVDVMLIP